LASFVIQKKYELYFNILKERNKKNEWLKLRDCSQSSIANPRDLGSLLVFIFEWNLSGLLVACTYSRTRSPLWLNKQAAGGSAAGAAGDNVTLQSHLASMLKREAHRWLYKQIMGNT
jgi:hypothetical protein